MRMQNEAIQLAHIIESQYFKYNINELHLNTPYTSLINVFTSQGNHIIKFLPLF